MSLVKPCDPTTRDAVRIMTRSAYDAQKLRMMVGNRLIANFKTRLGLDLTKPEQDQADVEKEAMKMLAELRAEYDRLADCFRSKKAREVAFSENRLLTSETAYYLADEYFGLLANEEKNFRNLGKVLEEVPIYVHFLKGVKGCGPAMSGVIISELDPHKARTPSSFWKYCFPEGVMVAAPSRQIPIENMVPGDVVLNAHGDEVLVKKTMRREYSGALYTIKAAGMLPVPATDEHPFLIERDDQQVWVKAEDLKVGDFLVFPKHVAPSIAPSLAVTGVTKKALVKNPRLSDAIPLNPETAYLFGKYVADGYCSLYEESGKTVVQRGVCGIVFGKHEAAKVPVYAALVEKYFGHYHIKEIQTDYVINFGRLIMARNMCEWFGRDATSKRIPEVIMRCACSDTIVAFIKGYFDGDGCVQSYDRPGYRGTMMTSSVSKELILQLQALLSRIGIAGSVRVSKRSNSVTIQGRMCNQQVNRYHLSIAVSDAMRVFGVSGNGIACRVPRKRMLDRGDYYATRIMQIKRKDVVGIQVYNLHTETNTYQVNNVAVHNCGLDVGPDGKGRSRKAEHLIDREYTDKEGNQSTRKSITYNPFAKTKLMGVLAGSFLRCGSPYAQVYKDYKARLENHPSHKDKTANHRHQMAMRYMCKRFLVDLYMAWRPLEGLEVTEEYAVRKLGMDTSHHAPLLSLPLEDGFPMEMVM